MSVVLNSRFHAELRDSERWRTHRETLNRIIDQYWQQGCEYMMSAQLSEGESQFYEAFKFQVAHQQLSDLISQVEMSSNLDASLKQLSTTVLEQASQILKDFGTQQHKVQIKITQSLYNLQRDTIRTIQELYDAFVIFESLKWPCRGPAQKSFDKQLRALDRQCFFWEQLITLENRNVAITAEKFISTEFNQQIDAWLDKIKSETQPKFVESIRKCKQRQQDVELKNAHELYAGLGTEKNQVLALQMYGRLAEDNNSIAQAIMGQILIEGQLGSLDYDQAFNYLKRSADQGNTFSVFWAAKLILEEKVFDKFFEDDRRKSSVSNVKSKDCDLAIKLLRKAAELDHVPSMTYLGDLYWHGLDLKEFILEKDLQDAEYFYKLAQKQNSVEAIYKLAMLYQEMSKQNLNKNRRQLIYPLLNQAKNSDYLPAFYDLGMLLLIGLGDEIIPNPIMADLIFEQAALKGDLKCATKLLNLRFQSLRKAEISIDDFFSLLEQLEDSLKNQSITHYMRGKVYSKGVQCERNLKKAIEEFRIGAQQGCPKCKAHLQKIEFDNPTNSQPSSIQRQTIIAGFIDQVKHSDWRKSYQKQIDRISQPKSNPLEENQSTRPDRHTIMTISILKPGDQLEKDRKRGASDYTNLKKMEGSVLLSQLKMQVPTPQPEQQDQQQFGSPRQPSLVNVSSNSSRKERFNFAKLPSNRSINSQKYLFNQS